MAGPFPQEFIESIREAADIVQVVSDYVPLKPAGSRLKGLCPFHEEKTPSFSVDPERQLFYCFGCQTGGDLFKFVMLYEKIPFGEAAEMLARRFALPLPEPGQRKVDDRLARLRRLNDAAAAFFETNLERSEATHCREYLQTRRLDPATVERLALGYAPDGWEGLRNHLLSKKFTPEEMQRAGLVLPRKRGTGEYDRFRDRLIFPIRDVNGRTIAFGGRALGDAEPKYVNSPETPAYKKGQHLYGLNLSRESIRREGFAVVVEGYLDLAALVQAGIENVVASLGTAFTAEQARLLARYSSRVVFSYDGDSAGASATTRSLDLLLAKGFEVRVVELPAGQDPDDYIGENGPEAYGKLLRLAPDYLEFLIRREAATRELSRIDEKVAAINAVLPHVARLDNPVARGHWAARLADALHVDEELVLQELRTAVKGARPRIRERAPGSKGPVPAELRLVSQLLRSAAERQRWCEELDLEQLEGTEVRPIVQAIFTLARRGAEVSYESVYEALDETDERDLLTRIAFREEPEEGPSVEDCLWAFRRRQLNSESRRVRHEINDLQKRAVSPEEVDRQLLRLQELARKRDSI